MLLLIQKESGTDIDLQGGRKEVKKSNHLVWCKNKVKLLFLAHQLRGNIHPFYLITLKKTWHLLFWSKLCLPKILRNIQKYNIRPIVANCYYKRAKNLPINDLHNHVTPLGPFGVSGLSNKPNDCLLVESIH